MRTDTTTLKREIREAMDLGLPFVIFREPGSTTLQAYIQNDDVLHEFLDFTERGFLVAPYSTGEPTFLFPEAQSKVLVAEISDSPAAIRGTRIQITPDGEQVDKSKAMHCALVESAVQFITKGAAEKIVLSRKEALHCKVVDRLGLYQKMLEMYPNAFCYLWEHPKVGAWMGATPETLLHVVAGNVRTMALAGTQPFRDDQSAKWAEKELKEQTFVTDFVIEKLRPFVEEVHQEGPYTTRAGSVVHLRTDIGGILSDKEQVSDLVEALHPTPAICGIPRDVAADFIVKNEGYSRTYYSGYLGQLKGVQTTALYVNLRCMQLEKDTVNLFIGGGITAESQPEKEWEETVQKAAVMKRVLTG